jgi:hypothetical protein
MIKPSNYIVNALFEEAFKLFEHKLERPYYWETIKADYFAEWSNIIIDIKYEKTEFHRFRINFKMHENLEDLRDTIAHEIIHAIQYEKKLPTDHGMLFARECARLLELGVNALSSEVSPDEFFMACNELKEI